MPQGPGKQSDDEKNATRDFIKEYRKLKEQWKNLNTVRLVGYSDLSNRLFRGYTYYNQFCKVGLYFFKIPAVSVTTMFMGFGYAQWYAYRLKAAKQLQQIKDKEERQAKEDAYKKYLEETYITKKEVNDKLEDMHKDIQLLKPVVKEAEDGWEKYKFWKKK
jgi:hypothetical protein